MSHGTQDLYPTFLQKQGNLGSGAVATVAVIYRIGAVPGGMAFGQLPSAAEGSAPSSLRRRRAR